MPHTVALTTTLSRPSSRTPQVRLDALALAELERRHLARDLHHNVIQRVLAAGFTIDWCLGEIPAGSPLHGQLEHAKRLMSAAARELRSSLQSLTGRPGADRGNLPELLRHLVDLHPAGPVELSLQVTGTPVALSAPASESLHRIASESLFNAVVHGRALHVDISLSYSRGLVTLSVADDGNGDADAVRKILRGHVPGTGTGYHMGLADMATMANEVGGTLRITPSSLGGIAVTATLPTDRGQRKSGNAHG